MRFLIPGLGLGRRGLCLLAVAGVLVAPAALAFAGVPSAANCTVDHVIIGSYDHLGAFAGNAPCLGTATRGFDVYVRDNLNNPVPNAAVSIIFAGTGTAIRPYFNQWPGATDQCSMHEIDTMADASGHAQIVPRFGRYGETAVVPVFANGVLLAMIQARSADYNDDGQVNLLDFNTFAADYMDPLAGHPRSDFDDCPTTKLGDFAFFADQYLASQTGPIEPICP